VVVTIPDRDVASDGIVVAEHPLGGHAAEHDHLFGPRLLAGVEEPPARDRPRAANQRQVQVRAVQPGEPAFVARLDVHVLMQTFRDVLHAANASNGLGVFRRERRGRPESGLAVTQTLARRRMIVLLHRIVFGVREQRRREERHNTRRAHYRDFFARFRALRDIVIPPERRRRFHGAAAEVVGRLHLVVAGGDDDQIHARGADLIFDGRFGAGADRDHRQHRRNADRHADDGQRRLQPVAP